jgi:hypothetical protein
MNIVEVKNRVATSVQIRACAESLVLGPFADHLRGVRHGRFNYYSG